MKAPARGGFLVRGIAHVALGVCLLLLAANPAQAALSSEQESLARSIEGKIIAPCCWTQTVADHDSEAADQIKSEIRTLIAQDLDEDEIINHYVDRYGETILASPRARGFNLLAYVLPFAGMLLVGIAATAWLLRRRSPTASSGSPAFDERPGAGGLYSRNPPDSQLKARMEQELSHFD